MNRLGETKPWGKSVQGTQRHWMGLLLGRNDGAEIPMGERRAAFGLIFSGDTEYRLPGTGDGVQGLATNR